MMYFCFLTNISLGQYNALSTLLPPHFRRHTLEFLVAVPASQRSLLIMNMHSGFIREVPDYPIY